jgi:hypothetical protein
MSTHPYRKYFESPATRGIRSIRAGHEAVLGLALIYAAIWSVARDSVWYRRRHVFSD